MKRDTGAERQDNYRIVTGGGKDSCVKAGKNGFLLAFSDGTVHTLLKINEYYSYALSQLKKICYGKKLIFFGLNTAVCYTES